MSALTVPTVGGGQEGTPGYLTDQGMTVLERRHPGQVQGPIQN